MGEMFSPKMRKLWDKWSIRGIIIFSLILQTILIFLAPYRKRMAKKLFLILIWSAYLLADWTADYAVGQISDSQSDVVESNNPGSDKSEKNPELLAFWAPFLLLHLGGPDTITALALEDNELWLRHFFGLVCQAIATVYVILLSTPNRLLLPTILMLVSGVIKYFERTIALHSASLDKFKDSMLQNPDPGPNYAKLMEEYAAKKDMKMPTEVIVMKEPEQSQKVDLPLRPNRELTHLEVVQYAYKYFNTFKGLLVDLFFSFQQRDESKKFYDSLTPEEALRILEVELSFIYDALFTKAGILHSWVGAVFRCLAFGFLVSSLYIFKVKKKDKYEGFDVGLTYALLIGGIALDFIAMLMFCLSDWTFARWRKLKEELDAKDTWVDTVINWVLSFRKLKWKEYKCFDTKESRKGLGHEVLDRKFILRRWSEYVHGYNLIGYCLRKKPERIHNTKGYIHRFFDSIIHILYIDCAISYAIEGIDFCFTAMKQGHYQIHSWINLLISYLSKKNRVIRKLLKPVKLFISFWFTIPQKLEDLINNLLDFFGVKDQVEEFMFTSSDRLTKELWAFIFKQVKHKSHFADDPETAKRIFEARNDWEIGKKITSARGDWILKETTRRKDENKAHWEKLQRYVTEVDYDQSILLWHIATELLYQEEEATEENYSHREFSKILSDYMMYLLIMQSTLTSAVAGIGKIRFRDTCEEANRFFQRRRIKHSMTVKKASEALLSINTEVEPMDVKGDRSKSVLFDAGKLATELQQLLRKREYDVWEVVSKVWVELLCYAAAHCDSKEHAAQLSKGGELISFVWLLMAHFGIGEQFQITSGDARSKLIVGK